MSVLGKRLTKEEQVAQQEKWKFRKENPQEYHASGEPLKDVAKKAFFEQSNLYKWSGALGEYTIWAYKNAGEMSEAEHAWPHAFVGKRSQTINAGMWFPVNDEFKLVAAWTFSVTSDKTSVYYLTEYQKDVWKLCLSCERMSKDPCPITSKASLEHFNVSSGDYEVKEFTCFALDTISFSEMQAFEEEFNKQKEEGKSED